MRLSALLLAALGLIGCLERPLDGEEVGATDNPIRGLAPGPGWQARLMAKEPSTGRSRPLPLFTPEGRAVAALVSADEPAEETLGLSPGNADDPLHRFDGLYSLPGWAVTEGRAQLTVELRPPMTTSWSPGFAYTERAFHECLLAGAGEAEDLYELGARCSTGAEVEVELR